MLWFVRLVRIFCLDLNEHQMLKLVEDLKPLFWGKFFCSCNVILPCIEVQSVNQFFHQSWSRIHWVVYVFLSSLWIFDWNECILSCLVTFYGDCCIVITFPAYIAKYMNNAKAWLSFVFTENFFCSTDQILKVKRLVIYLRVTSILELTVSYFSEMNIGSSYQKAISWRVFDKVYLSFIFL